MVSKQPEENRNHKCDVPVMFRVWGLLPDLTFL